MPVYRKHKKKGGLKMTVGELKKLLADVPDDLEVWFQPGNVPITYPVARAYVAHGDLVLDSEKEE
jgi:hypothetical protein